MARARNIKPGFYKNEDLAECSVWARLIFPGLWMLADREGRLEDRPKRIKGELLPFDAQDMEPLLRELASHGFIVRYEVDGVRYIEIPKFTEHQSPHYSEKASVLPPPNSGKFGSMKTQPLPESERDMSSQDSESNGGIMTDRLREDSGRTPENSGSDAVIKRGSQPPDSLNPDSLNPESLQTPPIPPSADAEGGSPCEGQEGSTEGKQPRGRRRTVNPEIPLPSPEWEPSDDAKAWTSTELAKHGLTDEWAWRQLDAMRDYAKQHPLWKHADWDATWRNWVRKAIERLPRTARAA